MKFMDSEDQSCWIAPDGKVTFVENGESHVRTADALGDETGGSKLEDEGYLHISYASIYTGYTVAEGRPIPPTQAQVDAVFLLAEHIAKEYPSSYVAERFFRFIEQNPVMA